jgi:hypothetical protein
VWLRGITVIAVNKKVSSYDFPPGDKLWNERSSDWPFLIFLGVEDCAMSVGVGVLVDDIVAGYGESFPLGHTKTA